MRAVVQRVTSAKVEVNSDIVGQIGQGLLVYIGAGHDDTIVDVEYIADKLVNLRIFRDENGKMNLSVSDIAGEILMISQFTLMADCRKGRRPGFSAAGDPKDAEGLYEKLIDTLIKIISVSSGIFGADMKISSVNDGPVTMLLDSKKVF